MVTQTLKIVQQIETRPEYLKIRGRILTSKVVGVAFGQRQEAVARLHIGDLVWLEREPDNPFDKNAILVSRNNGEILGYLNRALAAHLARFFDIYGYPISGRVLYVTGGIAEGYNLGCVVRFKIPNMIQKEQHHMKHQISEWED